MLFWSGIILMIVLAVLAVTLPLWHRRQRLAGIVASVVLAAVAFGGYLSIGNPHQVSGNLQAAQPEDIESLVAKLAERLENEPEDVEGWTMLGRAYVMMGRFDEAADAYSEVLKLTQRPPADMKLDYIEAMVLADMRRLESSEVALMLDGVLERAPDNPRALWYGGLAAEANDDMAVAVERWQRLLEQELPSSFRQVAEDRLLRVDPDALDVVVTVNVDIAREFENELPREGSLFVTLRQPDAAEGTPPLAARRLAAFRYPVAVRFRQRDLLGAGTLPTGPLDVLARITSGNDALRTSGGMQGTARWDRETGSVNVTIDRRTQ